MRERGRAWAAGPRGTQQSALARSGHVARRWRPRRSFPSRRWAPSRPGAPEVRPSRARSDPAARGCRARPARAARACHPRAARARRPRAALGCRAARARPRARAAPAGAAGRRRAGTGSSSPPRRLAPRRACSLAGRLRSAARRGARGALCRSAAAHGGGRSGAHRRPPGRGGTAPRRRRSHWRRTARNYSCPPGTPALSGRTAVCGSPGASRATNQERRHAPRCLSQEAGGRTAAPRTPPAHRLCAQAGGWPSRRGPPQHSGNSAVRHMLMGVPAEQTSLLARSRAHVVSILWARQQSERRLRQRRPRTCSTEQTDYKTPYCVLKHVTALASPCHSRHVRAWDTSPA